MEVTGRACDVCNKFSPTSTTPMDWFLTKRPGQMDSEAQEVCSAACLCKLGRQMKTMPVTEGFLCPSCDRVFKTQQGVSMHITRRHDQIGADS